MPLYEYYCADCRTTFDVLRSMGEADAPIPCERCEGRHTSRVLTVAFTATSSGKAVAGTGASACACGGHCGCGHRHN